MKGPVGIWEALRYHLDDALWHEVILLTVGYKAIIEKYDQAAAYLVRKIAAEPDEHDGHGDNVVLAGRCLADVGRGLVPDDCWEDVVEQLILIMQDLAPDGCPNEPPLVPIPTRYAAAETLDRLRWLPDDLDTFVEIPISNLQSPTSNLQSPIYIAKYPVTNAQFALFRDAGGYDERGRRWWSDEGWEWRKKGERRWSERGADQPEYWDHPRFGESRRGYPVVGVSWYEANAYCAWLTEQLYATRNTQHASRFTFHVWRDGKLETLDLEPGTLTVRLPAEAEWEAAAGGAEGERYPWGPKWHESRANTGEGGIGGTTPVGGIWGATSGSGWLLMKR